ncbi:MAG: peroxiredoxin [Sandaracinus sp.]|jgi:peroxiredoxin Q/BCP|nr:peroxiredoxin [Sandaracinus sp.]MCB9634848.1 peroxiredoxin [Sandaracinus sp.]
MRALVSSLALILLACGGAPPEPRTGELAPDFEAQDHTGETRTLHDYAGKVVVLYFYPRDATPGCTTEACAFRDAWDRMQAAGAVVLGVSTDDVDSHRAFVEEHQLPFALLADTDGRIAQSYGVPVRMNFAKRMTFVIDANRRIRRVFEEVDPAVHVDEVLAVLDELRRE